MFKEHLLTPAELIDWLSDKSLDEVAGYAGIPYSCPVACFLDSLDIVPKTERISVGLTKLGITSVSDEYLNCIPETTPSWVKQFILAIDALPNREVSVETCFEILEKQIPDVYDYLGKTQFVSSD